MSLRSGAKREGEGRPHFGVKQYKSDILPTHACASLGGCRDPRLLRNHALIAGVCFAGVLLNLWCQPSVRHTRQVSYAPLFLQAFALLSRAVVFSALFTLQSCLGLLRGDSCVLPGVLPLMVNVCRGQGTWCDLPQGGVMWLHSSGSLPMPE